MRTAYYVVWTIFIINISLFVYSFFRNEKPAVAITSETGISYKEWTYPILLLIDSVYIYNIKVDSIQRLQLRVLCSKEDFGYIKLESNRLQGKANYYQDIADSFMKKANSYTEFNCDTCFKFEVDSL